MTTVSWPDLHNGSAHEKIVAVTTTVRERGGDWQIGRHEEPDLRDGSQGIGDAFQNPTEKFEDWISDRHESDYLSFFGYSTVPSAEASSQHPLTIGLETPIDTSRIPLNNINTFVPAYARTLASNLTSSPSIQNGLLQNKISFLPGFHQKQRALGEMNRPFHEVCFRSKTTNSQDKTHIITHWSANIENDVEDDQDQYVQVDNGCNGAALPPSTLSRPAKRLRSNNNGPTNFQSYRPGPNHSVSIRSLASPQLFPSAASTPQSTTNISAISASARTARPPYLPNAAGKYPCPDCPKIFESSSSVSRHVRGIHDQIKDKCDTCGRTFADKRRRDGHQNNPRKGQCYLDWQRGRYPDHPDYEAWKDSRLPGQIGYVVPGSTVPASWELNPQNPQSLMHPNHHPSSLSSVMAFPQSHDRRNNLSSQFGASRNGDVLARQGQAAERTSQHLLPDRTLYTSSAIFGHSNGTLVARNNRNYGRRKNGPQHICTAAAPALHQNLILIPHQQGPLTSGRPQVDSSPMSLEVDSRISLSEALDDQHGFSSSFPRNISQGRDIFVTSISSVGDRSYSHASSGFSAPKFHLKADASSHQSSDSASHGSNTPGAYPYGATPTDLPLVPHNGGGFVGSDQPLELVSQDIRSLRPLSVPGLDPQLRNSQMTQTGSQRQRNFNFVTDPRTQSHYYDTHGTEHDRQSDLQILHNHNENFMSYSPRQASLSSTSSLTKAYCNAAPAIPNGEVLLDRSAHIINSPSEACGPPSLSHSTEYDFNTDSIASYTSSEHSNMDRFITKSDGFGGHAFTSTPPVDHAFGLPLQYYSDGLQPGSDSLPGLHKAAVGNDSWLKQFWESYEEIQTDSI